MTGAPNPRSPSEELAFLRRQIVELEQRIGELTRKEQAVEREEERLSAVLLNMPVMIDAFDSDWSIVLWNRECERVTGYSAGEIVGNPRAMELLYPNQAYRERMIHEWRERGDDYRNWRWEMMAKDGSVKTVAWYNISRTVPLPGWRTWGIGVDITEQRRTAEAIEESERRLKDVFENVPVGIYHTSPDGRVLMANPAFVGMLGYSSFGELAQQNLEEVTLGSQYPRSAFRKRLEREGRVIGFESAWTRRDGSTLHTIENARVVRDVHGHVLYYEGAIEDITRRAQMEAALRESESRYRTLVESAGETIAVVNEEGVFLFMNTTAAKRLGGEPEAYIGKTMWKLFPLEIADRQMASIRTVIRTGRGMNVIVPTTLQGTTRWYDTTIEPLSDTNREIHSVLIVGRDIHELQQARRELEEYRTHMARAERLASLGTLSATVAHEMNQPLTVIRLTIQNCLAQLEGEGLVQGLVDDLKDCLEEVSVVTSIVDRIKGFATHSSRRRTGKTNLQGVAEKVVRVLEDAAKSRHVRLVLERLDHLGELDVDERDMEQVFFSLVENAIQAADGTTDHQVLIRGMSGGTSVELQFADDCGGIAPGRVDRIFDPFFTTKSDNEGTGLGLCIVEQALSRARGTIRVENRPGEGATFIITLSLSDNQ